MQFGQLPKQSIPPWFEVSSMNSAGLVAASSKLNSYVSFSQYAL